jgi:hypothetical protein
MILQTLIKYIIVIWTRFFRQQGTSAIFSILIELIIISNIGFLMYTIMKQVYILNAPEFLYKYITNNFDLNLY